MKKKYKVKLTPDQHKQLLEIVHNRKQKAKTIPMLGYEDGLYKY